LPLTPFPRPRTGYAPLLAARKAFPLALFLYRLEWLLFGFSVTLAARKAFHASADCVLEVSRLEGSLFSCYNAPPFQ